MASFDPIADSLRVSLISYYRETRERLGAAAWHNTLETNSGWVERRARPLVEIYRRASGRETLRGVRVLDLGCGFGAVSVFLASQGADVSGVDPNGRRLAVGQSVADQHGLRVSLQRGSMEQLEFADASFDLLVQNNSLCYVVDPDRRAQGFAHVRRVLRPNGYLIIRDPNRLTPVDQFTGLPGVHLLPVNTADRVARALGRPRSRVRMLTPRAARSELRRAGLQDVRSVPSPESRWPAAAHRIARYQHLVAVRR